mgnify:CR=1 FL=1
MNLRKALVGSIREKCAGKLHLKVDRFIKASQKETGVSSFSVVTLENGSIGISYNLFHRDPEGLRRYRRWLPHVVRHRPVGRRPAPDTGRSGRRPPSGGEPPRPGTKPQR